MLDSDYIHLEYRFCTSSKTYTAQPCNVGNIAPCDTVSASD